MLSAADDTRRQGGSRRSVSSVSLWMRRGGVAAWRRETRGGRAMENEKCLRCGAPYEPDATVCLTCGAPIGETRSSTQPVRAVKVARDEPAPSAEPAPEADPSRVRTLAGPALASRPAAVATSARRGPSARLIAIVFVVVLVLAGGAIYAARALTAGPPVSHQSVYHDPQHRF